MDKTNIPKNVATLEEPVGPLPEVVMILQHELVSHPSEGGLHEDGGKRGAEAAEATAFLEAKWSGHLMDPGAGSLGVAYAETGCGARGRHGTALAKAAILRPWATRTAHSKL